MSILTQIGTSGIKANAITTDKILDANVTTPKIADGDITSAKLEANAAFIPGMILMWSGTILTIPTGWGLCDGTTYAGPPDVISPDLRDRFIIGANQDDSSVAKTNITGSLTQTGGSKDAILVSHGHDINLLRYAGNTHFNYGHFPTHPLQQGDYPVWQTTGYSTNVGGGGKAVRTAGSSGTNRNLPPYYSIAYIIKKPI